MKYSKTYSIDLSKSLKWLEWPMRIAYWTAVAFCFCLAIPFFMLLGAFQEPEE